MAKNFGGDKGAESQGQKSNADCTTHPIETAVNYQSYEELERLVWHETLQDFAKFCRFDYSTPNQAKRVDFLVDKEDADQVFESSMFPLNSMTRLLNKPF